MYTSVLLIDRITSGTNMPRYKETWTNSKKKKKKLLHSPHISRSAASLLDAVRCYLYGPAFLAGAGGL